MLEVSVYRKSAMKIWSNNSKGTRFPGVDYMKYETEFLKVKGRSFMNKFQIGDKVIVTAHKEDMEYPCISAKKDLFNLVGTICGVCTSWNNGSMSYKVAFEENIGGHDCNGTCKDGYGQIVNEKYLKLYDKKKSEDKTMQKDKCEKKPLEQQIKEKYESKRNVLNIKIGFTGGHEQTLVPKKVYHDSTTSTIVIDFGDSVGKIKAKPIADDKYDPSVAFNIIVAKAIYKRFSFPFESDMSSFEAKITAKYLLHKNTGIALDKYIKYLKNMVQTFLQEDAELEKAEQIRKNQKAKNRIRKERQKQRRQNRK